LDVAWGLRIFFERVHVVILKEFPSVEFKFEPNSDPLHYGILSILGCLAVTAFQFEATPLMRGSCTKKRLGLLCTQGSTKKSKIIL